MDHEPLVARRRNSGRGQGAEREVDIGDADQFLVPKGHLETADHDLELTKSPPVGEDIAPAAQLLEIALNLKLDMVADFAGLIPQRRTRKSNSSSPMSGSKRRSSYWIHSQVDADVFAQLDGGPVAPVDPGSGTVIRGVLGRRRRRRQCNPSSAQKAKPVRKCMGRHCNCLVHDSSHAGSAPASVGWRRWGPVRSGGSGEHRVRGCHCVQRLSAHTRRPIATLTPTANRNPDRGG